MNLSRAFGQDLKQKGYDPRIEITRKTSTEITKVSSSAWALSVSCSQFISFLKNNLLPSRDHINGKHTTSSYME